MASSEGQSGSVGRIIFGLLLTALWIFLAISLIGYSPRDPSSGLIFPVTEGAPSGNPCGTAGGAVAAFLFDFCGVGVWFLLFALFLRLISYWRNRLSESAFLKTLGVFLMLTAISSFAALLIPATDVGTLFGPGGRLGACGRELLDGYFARIGSLIFLLSLLIAGAILACDGAILRFLLWVTGLRPLSELLLAPFRKKRVPTAGAPPQQPQFPPLPDAVKEKIALGGTSPAEHSSAEIPLTAASSDAALSGTAPSDAVSSDEAFPDETLAEREEESAEEFSEIEPDSEEGDNSQETESYPDREPRGPYAVPSMELLDEAEPLDMRQVHAKALSQAVKLEKALVDFDINVQVVDTQTGPVLSLHELALEKGLRVKKIRAVADDLQIALKVPSVRVVYPIPGKNTVGIEVPNTDRQFVRLREVMEEGRSAATEMQIPIFLGKDVAGDPMVVDMAKMPHLLIAGRTGTGKSVCLNSIILSILMTRTPEEVQMLMIDPKMVELGLYRSIPHLMHPVIADFHKAAATLEWVVAKMEERYQMLFRAGARNLQEFNRYTPTQLRQRIQPVSEEEWAHFPRRLPYLVVIADEMGDLMMAVKKDIEPQIIRLAQKSRAIGIHLILATQKPTVDVITGLIRSNLPARIAFGVTNRMDSMVVLDRTGAERLLGNGDMLFMNPGGQVIRGQGTFVSKEEIEAIISEIAVDQPRFIPELETLFDETSPDKAAELLRNRDSKYNEAVEYIIQEGRGSTSLLQRRFGIGYGRAARMIDTMAAEGVVGPYNGSQAREVVMSLADWHTLNGLDENGQAIADAVRTVAAPQSTVPPAIAASPEPPWIEPEEEIEEEEFAEEGDEAVFEEPEDEVSEEFSEAELPEEEVAEEPEVPEEEEVAESPEEELIDERKLSEETPEELFAETPNDGEKPSDDELFPLHPPKKNLRQMAKDRRNKKRKKRRRN